jgi:hypothetical protein
MPSRGSRCASRPRSRRRYLKDGAFPQLLLFSQYSHAAADRIQRAIYAGTRGEKRLLPSLRPYEPIVSTDDVWFETTKTCFETTKSHLNLVVQDSGWESKLAETLESIPEVLSYVKNQGLNFKIPYRFEGRDGRRPVGSSSQQLGRRRPLGIPGGHGSVGCRTPDPCDVRRFCRSRNRLDEWLQASGSQVRIEPEAGCDAVAFPEFDGHPIDKTGPTAHEAELAERRIVDRAVDHFHANCGQDAIDQCIHGRPAEPAAGECKQLTDNVAVSNEIQVSGVIPDTYGICVIEIVSVKQSVDGARVDEGGHHRSTLAR